MSKITRRSLVLSLLALPACGGAPDLNTRGIGGFGGGDIPEVAHPRTPPRGTEAEIAELNAALLALGPGVDPEEAARAARISYVHTHELAIQYQITDPALIHNTKVNLGLKPRGLCNDWAEDMEKRLVAEDFQTFTIHRAIGALVGVDHSTVIISRRGDSMYDGIVIDPWRRGGRLTWIATRDDTAWGWEPQHIVLDREVRQIAIEQGKDRIIYQPEGGSQRCLVLPRGLDPRWGPPSTTDLSQCLSGPEPVSSVFAFDVDTL
jgi:hypothetical protein